MLLSDEDFHPIVGAYSQAHTLRPFRASRLRDVNPGLKPWEPITLAIHPERVAELT